MSIRYILYSLTGLILLVHVSCKPAQNLSSAESGLQLPGWVQIDHLGNHYQIDADWRINKYDVSGQLLQFYSNRYFGEVSSLDISDPLKILVFYEDQQQIVILDNMMSEMAVLDLSKLNDVYIEAVAKAIDGNIWLFDSNKGVLLKTDENLVLLLEGFPLSQEGINGFFPQQIIVHGQNLLINDSAQGVLVFDNYTGFKQLLPIKKGSILVWENPWFYYRVDNSVFKYNLDLFDVRMVHSFARDENIHWYFGIRENYIYLFDREGTLKEKLKLNEGT